MSSSGARSGELEDEDSEGASDGASLGILAVGLDRAIETVAGLEGCVDEDEGMVEG